MGKRKNSSHELIVLSDSESESKSGPSKPAVSLLGSSTGDSPSYDSLALDILVFDPHKHIDTSSWTASSSNALSIPYAFLTAAFIHLSKTRSRIAITTVLTNTLRTIIAYQPSALCDTIYLLTNHIGPTYEKRTPLSSSTPTGNTNANANADTSTNTKDQLGIGSQIMTKVLKESCGLSPKELKVLWNKHGDMGDVAFHAKRSIRTLQLSTPPPLLITKVYSTLLQISSQKGARTTESKANLIKSMFISAKGEEVRYLVRTLVSNLRIGAVRLTVLSSLARAFCLLTVDSCSKIGDDLADLSSEFIISHAERHQYIQNLSNNTPSSSPTKRKKTSTNSTNNNNNNNINISISSKKNNNSSSSASLPPNVQKKFQNSESLIRQIYVQHPNYNHMTEALLQHGLQSKETLLNKVGLTVGIPLCPMLGQITRDVSDIVIRLPPRSCFTAEWKYDGQRVQIHALQLHQLDKIPSHLSGGGKVVSVNDKKIYVRLFSRHLEDMTEKYPDVIDLIPLLMDRTNVTSFIMDAEVCAIDTTSGALKTFQTLSNRAKKDVQLKDVSVNVGLFAFDLMYFNGKSILKEPFRKRRDLLRTNFPPFMPPSTTIARFNHVHSFDGKIPVDDLSSSFFSSSNNSTNETEQEESVLETLRSFMNDAISNHCEGLMVKMLDNTTDFFDAGNAFSTSLLEFDRDDDYNEDVNDDDDEELSDPNQANKDDDDADDDIKVIQQSSNNSPSKTPSKNNKASLSSPQKDKNKKPLAKKPKSSLLSTYEPDKRADSWLKCKRDYGALGDSIDLVPIGAWHGMGRKAGWWSPILLALYDPETGHFQAVCKCISGFTDAFYISLNERYPKDSDTCSSRLPLASVDTGGVHPDVWWLPNEVWEIRGADITLSPVYPASQGLANERGLSLRFPRFYRVRQDKSIEQATSSHEFAAAYCRQAGLK